MPTIQQYSQFAELMQAAYARFGPVRNTAADEDGLRDSRTGDFAASQASAFLGSYDIVDHMPNDAVGFSATLFKNKTTGEYTLALRGRKRGHSTFQRREVVCMR
jgi:hypothetical protein